MSARSGRPGKESRRRRRGFERVDRGSLVRGTLPAKRVRELLLAEAWRRVAGATLARRAVAERVRRGVLELTVSDPGWADAVASLVPQLAGRLSRRFPDLGIRRFRLQVGTSAHPVQDVPPDADPEGHAGGPDPASPRVGRAVSHTDGGRPPADVADVARRYLERARKRRSS